MARGVRATVLVIEDEESIREFMRQALESVHDVMLAANGAEGLARAEREKPDLILLDLRMPGLDGLSVLSRLKAHQKTSGIPVVIVSGQGDTDALLEGQRAGAIDHIIKPFRVEDLYAVVQRQLSFFGK